MTSRQGWRHLGTSSRHRILSRNTKNKSHIMEFFNGILCIRLAPSRVQAYYSLSWQKEG